MNISATLFKLEPSDFSFRKCLIVKPFPVFVGCSYDKNDMGGFFRMKRMKDNTFLRKKRLMISTTFPEKRLPSKLLIHTERAYPTIPE